MGTCFENNKRKNVNDSRSLFCFAVPITNHSKELFVFYVNLNLKTRFFESFKKHGCFLSIGIRNINCPSSYAPALKKNPCDFIYRYATD